MQNYLIGGAAVLGVAVLAVLGWRLRKRVLAAREERHIQFLRDSLKTKPVVKPAGEVKASAPAATVPPPKTTSTALMIHPDHEEMRTNGAWLHRMNFTSEPDPIHGTRASVRQSESRSRQLHDAVEAARKSKNWQLAEERIAEALAEVRSGLRQDHWYTATVLNLQGCLLFDQGHCVEAREIWEQAEQVCEEWPTRCSNILPTIKKNLKLAKDRLGF